ncbi:MAG TPA: pitrilysin family protein [Bacteroidia bacterium]|nr:pitrilysin family protein [Bacteroidia bacterium]
MTLNRNLSPEFHTVDSVHLIQPETQKLSNGTPVHLINSGDQEVVRIDFIFHAGTRYQPRTLVASSVNDTIDEGTKTRNAESIAEELDFYGAFIESEVNQDCATFTLFSLNKHLASTLPIVEDILVNATFPQEEFEIFRSNKKQQFIVDSDKVSTLARRRFSELIFGENHAYGRSAKLEDFDTLQRESLVDFHKEFYSLKNCSIVVSGRITDVVFAGLEKQFGKYKEGKTASNKLSAAERAKERIQLVEKKGAIQSAIRMGRALFNKTHPDYMKMLVLNTAFGGYFGSRLMANIREDKGYTYGIGSGLVSMLDGGYFVISTEVGVDVTSAALKEIYFEIERMQNDLIPEE